MPDKKVEALEVKGTDEIEELTESFNRMVTQVNILMKEVGKKWSKEKKK